MRLIVNNHNTIEKNIQIYFSTFILRSYTLKIHLLENKGHMING